MRKFIVFIFDTFILPLVKIYWFIFRPQSIGVKCIIQHNGKILLIKNSYGHKFWTLPGGGIKRKESLEETVKREVKEEVGINVGEIKKCGHLFYDGEYKKNTVWVFKAVVNDMTFTINNYEINEAQWFKINELPTKKSFLLEKYLDIANIC